MFIKKHPYFIPCTICGFISGIIWISFFFLIEKSVDFFWFIHALLVIPVLVAPFIIFILYRRQLKVVKNYIWSYVLSLVLGSFVELIYVFSFSSFSKLSFGGLAGFGYAARLVVYLYYLFPFLAVYYSSIFITVFLMLRRLNDKSISVKKFKILNIIIVINIMFSITWYYVFLLFFIDLNLLESYFGVLSLLLYLMPISISILLRKRF